MRRPDRLNANTICAVTRRRCRMRCTGLVWLLPVLGVAMQGPCWIVQHGPFSVCISSLSLDRDYHDSTACDPGTRSPVGGPGCRSRVVPRQCRNRDSGRRHRLECVWRALADCRLVARLCGGCSLRPPQRIKRTLSTSSTSGVVDGFDDVDQCDGDDDGGKADGCDEEQAHAAPIAMMMSLATGGHTAFPSMWTASLCESGRIVDDGNPMAPAYSLAESIRILSPSTSA